MEEEKVKMDVMKEKMINEHFAKVDDEHIKVIDKFENEKER